tara:strand:+ start:1272 stop:2066 length:795 start_codon:yes stop_codon:yes gene_type:complete
MHCGNRFKAHRRNREYEWQKYCQRSCYTAARRGAEKRYGNPERSKQWHPGLTAEDALAVQDMNRSTSPPSMAEETSAMALMEIESRGSGQTAAEFLTTTGSDSLPVDASSAASKPRRGFVSYLDFVGPVGMDTTAGKLGSSPANLTQSQDGPSATSELRSQSPLSRLVLAMLELAARDIARGTEMQRESALRWVTRGEDEYNEEGVLTGPTSFINCCQWFDLDPDIVADGLCQSRADAVQLFTLKQTGNLRIEYRPNPNVRDEC